MEHTIAYYCAPALAGIKPSNIVACYKDKIQNIHAEVKRLNRELNRKDMYLEILCECDRRVLLMVYRKTTLEKHLAQEDIRRFLAGYGYRSGNIGTYISFLKTRLRQEDFPHEIGAFLGYPLHDIYGFIHHKNEGCLLCGEWKVYQNAEEAEKLFKRFSACRRAVVKRIHSGKTLAQVFCAA